MLREPVTSVIIPTYNRAHLLERAIKSILDQTYQNFEIIVVDDGSTDNTEDVVEKLNDPRIRYIRHKTNKGAGAARNTGIKAAKGKYIAFQDSDDEWLPEKLETQMKTFNVVSSDIGMVYTDMLRIKKEGEVKYLHSPTVRKGDIINPKTLDFQLIGKETGIGIISTLIKRECFNVVGYFDETYPKFEDLELFIRLSKHYNFHHIKKPLVRYYEVEGISSNPHTLPIARKLLLETYFDNIKTNKAILANQYSIIGYALLSDRKFREGRSYFIKAFKTDPLNVKSNIKLLLMIIVSISGQNMYDIVKKIHRKIQDAIKKSPSNPNQNQRF